jgi:hypothetical protein
MNEETSKDAHKLPDPSTMTIPQLKSELLSMNNPSFVFNNRSELESALKSARRLEEVKNKSIGSNTDEETHGLDISEVTSGTTGSMSFHDADEPALLDDSTIETPDEEGNEISRRLVEYFVMVSSVPICKDGKTVKSKRRKDSPPDPSRDKMNSRTKGRFEVRRAHLSNVPVEENIPTIKETDGKDETASTTSTSSTVDETPDGTEGGGDTLKPSNAMAFNIPQDNHAPGCKSVDDDTEDYLLEPVITARYPAKDHEDQPLNPRLPQFCHPEGTDLIQPTKEYKMPRIHFFVLTDNIGGKQYGTCLTVYEEFHREGEDENTKKKNTYYAPRVLCLLSTYPYLTAFRTYLTQLYRLATTTNVMTAPIERYVQNICYEVPAPPPGAFEVQLNILGSSVRFWAPPADQPVAYVSLPFKVLFECLDIGNILFAWYTLACERKVLLVSGQLSLLTVCSEILCSLLFPMRWSHLYIPVLPRSLSPMLDAPMPYLCGISRENFPYAVADISDETVVVDLDRNVITLGPGCQDLPPLPHKRRLKLENALKANCGEVFWEARNLNKAEVLKVRSQGDQVALASLLRKAGSVWDERIRTRDDAFNLAYLPDSTTLEFSDDANCDAENGTLPKQSKWDAVQEAFLRFYVAMLQDYRKFMPTENVDKRSSWRGKEGVSDARFKIDEFIQASSSEFRPFIEELVMTQQFDDFITKRMFDAKKAPDVIFFDQSIEAKKNRSRRKFKKVDTPFLHSASAHRDLKRVQAVEPTCEGLPPLNEGGKYSPYKMWPVTFDEKLFGTPRPIPKIISAEFDRQSALRAMFRSQAGGDGGRNTSPEATAFILFFLTFTKVIGKEFSKVEAKHDGIISHRTLANLDDDMSVAHIQAKAQIDLAYHTLSLMRLRKLPPEPAVYKSLIQACGNAKVTHRAPELMEMIARDGLATNSEIYTSLIAAFSNGSEAGPSALAMIYNGDNVSDVSSSHGGSHMPLMDATSEHGSMVSDLTPPGSTNSGSTKSKMKSFRSSLGNKKVNPFKRHAAPKRLSSSANLTKKNHMRVNSAIAKHIQLGESLIESIYPDIKMDTDSDACPKCAKTLSEDQIIMGWTPCASKEYETECPSCKAKFVPKFCVTCSSPDFQGSQGKGSALYCDYLSPWVLLREMKCILSKAGIENVLDERFRSGSGINATLWWNMVITFRRYKLPYIFLLQGSFSNQLILPSPEINDES